MGDRAKAAPNSHDQNGTFIQKLIHSSVRDHFFKKRLGEGRTYFLATPLMALQFEVDCKKKLSIAHGGGRVVSASGSETSVASSTPASAIIYDAYTSIIKKHTHKKKKKKKKKNKWKSINFANKKC